MTRDEALKVEIPFQWQCPSCWHVQTDTVNPVLGPFLYVTCGECQHDFEESELSEVSRAAFDAAVVKAEDLFAGK